MKKLLTLTLSLALALTLCGPALAVGENGKPTIDEFLTHWSMKVNVPGVEDTKIACEPYYLYDYNMESDNWEDYISDGYEYKSYHALTSGATFVLTNTATDVNCRLWVNLTTYEMRGEQYVPMEEYGGYNLYEEGFRLRALMGDTSPVYVTPGESLTFDLTNIQIDGAPIALNPDAVLLIKVTAYYPDYDWSSWNKTPYRIDEAGVAGLRAAAAAPAGVTAKSGTAKVLLDGEAVVFDAYMIEQNNYVKLRDFAQMVSGSGKRFDVSWNGAKNAIELASGKAYTAVGGEMTAGDGTDKHAIPSSAAIYKDGTAIDLKAYTIDQNNYFKLRDLCRAFDIYVGWNSATGTVSIDTTRGYVAE